jgi:hypothetical protein
LDTIKNELDKMIQRYTPSSAMGKAIKYTLNNWDALILYCEKGSLPIDNNAAERTLRTIVLGRKNWLFAGSKAAGSWAAVCYTIMESCRLLKIDPRKYIQLILKPLLTNRDNPDFDYSDLTPVKMAPHIRLLDENSEI